MYCFRHRTDLESGLYYRGYQACFALRRSTSFGVKSDTDDLIGLLDRELHTL